jgi:hypothetical protein
VRNTGKIFEFIDDVKKVSDNIDFFISIYFNADIEIGNIDFFEKYEMPAERTDWEIIIGMKNSARPQFSSKRRKLIRL